MTDKAKIRAEIERRYNERDKIGDNIRANVHKSLISFIDSMQEEPVNEPVDFEQELYKAFGQVKDFTLGMRIAKRFYDIGNKSREPVSENLEDAVDEYAPDFSNSIASKAAVDAVRDAFTSGANWQKTKDESISEDLGNYINELSKQFPEVSFAKLSRIAVRVAKWQKEKMMAKATDATIGLPYENKDGGYTHLIDVSRPLPVGNNKIAIIFKED